MSVGGEAVTQFEYSHKLDELDRLLNDPDVPMEPARVWSLLAEISGPRFEPGEVIHDGTAQPWGIACR
ncbi:hypothetical protein Asru_0143_16 [Acidisphaera rubrifaciens HS-AP3]|uniref:Uncharacterized protein n=1 Tax=Acidisphaera rubrifaciens HS-AP3 TaxID=1231350 RepID=A0A0D6P4W5_9PROT|nr:hypothetical protein Asru_0143_16 [Acidisphaera rubrifaciens HS-AP3]